MIDKKSSNYIGLLYIIIVLLLIVIGEVYYFSNKGISNVSNGDIVSIEKNNSIVEKIEVTMITDKRCGDKCNVDPIIAQLKQVPSLSKVDIKVLDYLDAGAKELLEKSGVKKLPAALFSNNDIPELSTYLKVTSDNSYYLELGASFDPTAKMSEKGFLVLDKKVLENIKADSYLKGDKNAKITWIEYSDLECPFCAKLHNSGTPEALEEKYGKNLNIVFQNFPLEFHKNALPGAEALECLAKEKGVDAYYELKHRSFKNKNSNLSFLTEEAVKLGVNKESFTKCVENKTFADKISKQQKIGNEKFGITGTPGNVLVNNETGEYEVISGAYPTSSFEDIIDRLLK